MSDKKLKKFIHSNIPLEYKRIRIRKYSLSDAQDYYTYTSDPNLSRYLYCSPNPNLSIVLNYIQGIMNEYTNSLVTRFLVEDRQLKHVLGAISIYSHSNGTSAELGYWVGPPYQGQGYGTEILEAIDKVLMSYPPLSKVFIEVDSSNISSIKIAKKIGLGYCGKTFQKHGRSIAVLEKTLGAL